ncbi:unnamed protein product [Angiostrongylus costaricensis]|uniref:TGS domain-containing protein n=1 Tax=Angiostrongylus costaricensis TaxID=334426 RepID=A0A158PLY9_ANGCS|nr:unnamed protein product [Angiostrongylus costaricensis]
MNKMFDLQELKRRQREAVLAGRPVHSVIEEVELLMFQSSSRLSCVRELPDLEALEKYRILNENVNKAAPGKIETLAFIEGTQRSMFVFHCSHYLYLIQYCCRTLDAICAYVFGVATACYGELQPFQDTLINDHLGHYESHLIHRQCARRPFVCDEMFDGIVNFLKRKEYPHFVASASDVPAAMESFRRKCKVFFLGKDGQLLHGGSSEVHRHVIRNVELKSVVRRISFLRWEENLVNLVAAYDVIDRDETQINGTTKPDIDGKLKNVFEMHVHCGPEIRFVKSGRGFFDVCTVEVKLCVIVTNFVR